VQFNDFCEGKGFYGFPSTSDLISDSNSLVNILVSKQNYIDCNEDGSSGKEICDDSKNLSKYIYIFTWNIGGFDQNISYNIWLTDDNTQSTTADTDYCFKAFNISDYESSGAIKAARMNDCWNLVLVKGDSHSSQDTLVARFLDSNYSYACVRYFNYETGTPIGVPENNDYHNMWSTWWGDSVAGAFGQAYLGQEAPAADTEDTFVCVQINNNGLGLDEEGDMMGDPYAVYSQTDQTNPDDASDDSDDSTEPTAATTTGIR
jgi:hypothetical protein